MPRRDSSCCFVSILDPLAASFRFVSSRPGVPNPKFVSLRGTSDSKGHQRYTFEVSPRNDQHAAIVVDGIVGYVADKAVNDENSGMFKIAEVPSNR